MQARSVAVVLAVLATFASAASAAKPVKVGAPGDCLTNPFCERGLNRIYGLSVRDNLVRLKPGKATYRALRKGRVQVAVGFSTDPQRFTGRFVQLKDDKHMIGADNIIPIYEAGLDEAYGVQLIQRFNTISQNLYNAPMRKLNERALDSKHFDAIADQWLRGHGLSGNAPIRKGPVLRFAVQDFRESKILSHLYAAGMETAGYKVQLDKPDGFRNVAYDALRYGSATVMIDYAASMTEFLDGNLGFTSDSTLDTLNVLRPWLAKDGMTAAQPTPARNHNVFLVTRRAAKGRELTKISDLADEGVAVIGAGERISVDEALPDADDSSHPVLSPGSTGPEVETLQRQLRELGYDKVDADGKFGPETEAAVRDFQRVHGLVVDGVVGQQTRAAIAENL